MSKAINEIQSTNFEQTISKGITLVDFWAPWCAPCKMQGQILEQIIDKVTGKAVVAKLNIDEASEIAGNLGINAIPTLILYKDSKEVSRMIGLQSEDKLVNEILSVQD